MLHTKFVTGKDLTNSFKKSVICFGNNIPTYCSVPKNRPNYVNSQSHKKYL